MPAPAASMLPFRAASLLPLLAGAALWGLAAAAYLTLFTFALDTLIAASGNAPEGAEVPAADALLVTLALAQLAVLPLGVAVVAGATGLSWLERGLAFAGFGLFFGQVSNSCAHELIHRSGRGLRRLGVAVYVSLLFGHHASAHPLVHHRHVATPADPNSARAGEGFYRFAPRAWAGSFREGWRAESARQARARQRRLPSSCRGCWRWRAMRSCNCCCRITCSIMACRGGSRRGGQSRSAPPIAGMRRSPSRAG